MAFTTCSRRRGMQIISLFGMYSSCSAFTSVMSIGKGPGRAATTRMMAQKSKSDTLLANIKNELGQVKAELSRAAGELKAMKEMIATCDVKPKAMKEMIANVKIADTPVKVKALTPHEQAKANGLFVDNIEERTGVSQHRPIQCHQAPSSSVTWHLANSDRFRFVVIVVAHCLQDH